MLDSSEVRESKEQRLFGTWSEPGGAAVSVAHLGSSSGSCQRASLMVSLTALAPQSQLLCPLPELSMRVSVRQQTNLPFLLSLHRLSRVLETATGSHCGTRGLHEGGICFKPQGCLFPLHWKDLFVAGIPGIIYGSISETGSSALHILADAISSHAAASSDNPQL